MTIRSTFHLWLLLAQAFWQPIQGEQHGSWSVVEIPALQGISASRIHFSGDRVGWVCGGLNRILKTVDSGKGWAVLPTNLERPGTDVAGLWFEDELQGWAVGAVYQEPTIWRSNDGGRSWEVKRQWPRAWADSTGALLDVRFVDRNHGWAVGFNGPNAVIASTLDAGEHWETQYSGSEFAGQFSRVLFRDAKHGWALSPNALVQTTDGGKTWKLRLLGGALLSDLDLDLSESKGVWVAGAWGHVLHTRDGLAWSRIPFPRRFRNHYYTNVRFIDREHGWVSGANCDIMATRDGGRTWLPEACPIQPGHGNEVTTGEMVATTSMLYVIANPGHLLMRPVERVR